MARKALFETVGVQKPSKRGGFSGISKKAPDRGAPRKEAPVLPDLHHIGVERLKMGKRVYQVLHKDKNKRDPRIVVQMIINHTGQYELGHPFALSWPVSELKKECGTGYIECIYNKSL